MRFAFSDDQRLLAASVRDYLAKECTPDVVRAVWDAPAAGDDLWRGLAELGIVGATVPEQHGGLGLDAVDVVLAVEEAGRAALPLPLAETVLVAGPLLIELGEHLGDEWLPRLASGEARVAVGLSDVDPLIAYAGDADLVAIVAEDSVVVARPEDLELGSARTIDPGRPTWTVAAGSGQRIEAPPDVAAKALDRAALAAAAQLTGVGLRMIELATAYALERHQFGRPIGSFQAVKHLLADALIAVEFARPVVYRAAHSVVRDSADRARDVSAAKVMAADAAAVAAKAALQVHGAIGYTWEHDLHLWMKRAWSLSAAYGTTDFHRTRVASAIL